MSGRRCSVCPRADRPEIDAAIVAGEAKRGISRRFAVSPDAVERHARAHVGKALVEAAERKGENLGDGLLQQIRDLQKRSLVVLTAAEKDGRRGRGLALGAVRQIRENILAEAKLLAELPAAAKPRRTSFVLTWGQSGNPTLRQPAVPPRPGVEGDDEARPDERDDEDREPLQ